jgi:hypothetical protein
MKLTGRNACIPVLVGIIIKSHGISPHYDSTSDQYRLRIAAEALATECGSWSVFLWSEPESAVLGDWFVYNISHRIVCCRYLSVVAMLCQMFIKKHLPSCHYVSQSQRCHSFVTAAGFSISVSITILSSAPALTANKNTEAPPSCLAYV